MRKASVAEWILSLATSPERAGATVGDLLEKSSAFWFSVFGTFVALVVDGLVSSPVRVVGLALVGFVAQFLVEIPGNSLAPHEGDVFTTTSRFSDVNMFFSHMLIGYLFSRVLRERALAACLVLAICDGIVTLMVVLKVGWAHYDWPGLVFAQSYVAGAVLFRLRYLHKHA
jgi:hypothetical protein